MLEYQINVARPWDTDMHGNPTFRHLFRTDWIRDRLDAKMVQDELLARFPGHSITVYSRSSTMTREVL